MPLIDQRFARGVAVAMAVLGAAALPILPASAGWYISFAAALAAAASCMWAARRNPPSRRGWTAFAGAALCWAAGDLAHLQAASNGVLSTLAAAAVADALVLLAVLLAGVAVLSFVGPALRGIALLRATLDGLVGGLSVFFFAWTTVLAPRRPLVLQTWDGALAVASPLLQICLVAVVLVGCARVGGRVRTSWWMLAAGTALIAVGDTVVAYLNLADLLHVAGLGIVARIAGLLLVALAALLPDDSPLVPVVIRPARGLAILLPYVPLLLAGTQIASQQVAGRLDTVSLVITGALMVLLGVRQLLVQFETLDLTRNLERRVTERTEALHLQERRFRSLAQNSSDLLMVLDPDGAVSYQSAAVERVLGFDEVELLGQSINEIVHPDDFPGFLGALSLSPPPPAPPGVFEVRLARRDGEWAMAEVTITNLLGDAVVGGILLTIRDIAERKALESQLRHDALHDPLTSLGNRQLFQDRLEHTAARAVRSPIAVAVLVIDLDGFKVVNDTLGHGAGDQLLIAVSERLRTTVRPSDTVSRMGGDEFAILLEYAPGDDSFVENVAARILARLRAPVDLDGKAVVPSGSVGVALGTAPNIDGEQLLRKADLALYAAKERGKGRYQIFEPGMEEAATEKMSIESDLRRAVRHDELVLHYQPIVGLPHGRITGTEALLRWNHPTRGLVPPNDFIPIAEESDLIGELGRWVLNQACTDLVRWQRTHPGSENLTVAVNVATRQLLTPWLVDQVAAALASSGLRPECLTLEITEGSLMADTKTSLATLHGLRALGVHLAIDDFGTGWSSLARLRTFPVDKLKIDRAFVMEIDSPHDDAPMVAAVTAMAHNLGLSVVAEGVETVEQLACLHRVGCDEVQGYLLSRPVPAERLEMLLSTRDGLFATDPEMIDDLEVHVDPAGDGDVTSAMLGELVRLSGLESAYLTLIDLEAGTQMAVAAVTTTELEMPVGLAEPFDGSPCARALAGAGPVTTDLRRVHPTHPLAAAGATWHLSVPVDDESGQLWGTLCLASAVADGDPPPDPDVGLVFARLFARLLTPRLATSPPAAASAPRSQPAVAQ